MAHTRIFVVAGPRACGKTTFIDRCRETGGAGFLPTVLSGLIEARGPVYFMELARLRCFDSTNVLVHVDLITPFAELLVATPRALAGALRPAAFADYPGAALLRDGSELNVLTLRIPRVVTLRRWLHRCAGQGKVAVPTVMAQLYSDASGDAAYSALYDAWDRYVAGLPCTAAWDVFETADGAGYSVEMRRS